jgi:dienelactone hydrolase
MTADAYVWVAERLAAIGCVVALPRTAGELFPDHAEFGLDLAFLVRVLRDANADSASPFYERMGPSTIAMGHSMGGGCSFLAMASDPTITAVANFAAAETNPSAVAACEQLDRPALLFAGTNDCVTPPPDHQVLMYEALSGWKTLVTIDGASHCQFNAYSLLCSLGEFCNANISRQDQQDGVWHLLEPWAKWVLFLDGAAARQFQTRLSTGSGFTFVQGGRTAVIQDTPETVWRLSAYPNPLRVRTHIVFRLSTEANATLEIFDVKGRLVRTLVDRLLPAGEHEVGWDGTSMSGRPVAAGVYLYRLCSGGLETTRRLLVLR